MNHSLTSRKFKQTQKGSLDSSQIRVFIEKSISKAAMVQCSTVQTTLASQSCILIIIIDRLFVIWSIIIVNQNKSSSNVKFSIYLFFFSYKKSLTLKSNAQFLQKSHHVQWDVQLHHKLTLIDIFVPIYHDYHRKFP